jgi:hypothetical protein
MTQLKTLFLAVISALLMCVAAEKSYSQTATLRGFVYEQSTGEPVIFTNVYFAKTSIGATTDENGYFAITRIPPGDYTLMVTYVGFDTLKIPITLKANDIISKKLFLTQASVNLQEVTVSASFQSKQTETQTSIIKIEPKEIAKIPTMGGTPDLAQYLQILPGVIFSGDQGGQLYIRGGPPIQNKVLYDGMVVYNPFHSIGLFSVFDVDILKNVNVYTGGFSAEYGGRISSIMDITTIDGNRKRIAGKFDISTFGAKALIQGPIVRQKTDSSGSCSFILSVKNSYLDESSQIFYSYIDQPLPYSYLDIYGKISVNAPNGSKVNFFGFDFNDNAVFYGVNTVGNEIQQVALNYNWSSYGGGTNFLVIPGRSSVLLEGNFAYSTYTVGLDEPLKSPRSSTISGFNGGFMFTYFFGKSALKYGLGLNGYKTVFNFFNQVNRKIDYTQNSTDVDLFGEYKWVIGKFVIQPGIRFEYYGSLSVISPEPRLAIKYNVTNRFRLKMAGGYFTQDLISTTNDLDVVNLFYGFLTSPENLPKYFDGKRITNPLQKAWHLILGFDVDITRALNLNVEGYYKYYPQLTNINRNKLFDDNEENLAVPDNLKKDFIIETGDAEGVDVTLNYNYKRFQFYATYSLGYIHRYDGISHYVPPYDRRNNLNITASFEFGKKLGWEIDGRYNYGSGFPFTPTQGYYEQIVFNNNMGTDYTTANGNLGILYGSYNSRRLPYYSRFDIDFKKTFFFGKTMKLLIDLSITNILDQQNIFYIDRITTATIYQLPILPSLGLSFSF